MLTDDDKLPDDINAYPPAAFGAGAPIESYAKYMKLRSGAWGLRVPGGATAGMQVTARTNAGQLRQERVGIIVWSGPDRDTRQPVAICTIAGQSAPRPQPAPQPQRAARPATKAPAQSKGRRAKRQPLPRIDADDGHDNREPSDATQVRIDAATKRLDDERAAAEAALNLPEPEF